MSELRFVIRRLRKNAGFTAIALLTLALGIGANTAIFSAVDHALMRPLPVEAPSRLAVVGQGMAEGRVDYEFNYPLYQDLKRGNTVFQHLSAVSDLPVGLGTDGETERQRAALVSGNYFAMLGVRPALGRAFAADEGAEIEDAAVAVLGHGLWLRRFGADPGVIGKRIQVNGVSFTVIGVAPREFTGTSRAVVPDLYLPITEYGRLMSDRPGGEHPLRTRFFTWHAMLGRLKEGVSHGEAEAAMNVLARQIHAVSPANTSTNLAVLPGARGLVHTMSQSQLPLRLLLVSAALVLLIACANLANLQLTRAIARTREFAVRQALGAGRTRLVRELLTESLVVSVAGGVLGLGVAALLIQWLDRFRPVQSASISISTADWRVLGFALVASLATGVAFGLVPALRASRPNLIPDLKGGAGSLDGEMGRSHRWPFRSVLVVVQVALSLVVLVSAGLCVRSLRKLEGLDPGFDSSRVVLSSVDLGLNSYEPARAASFYGELLARVRALPGIESAALSANLPLSGHAWSMSLERIEGFPSTGGRGGPVAEFNSVSPDYFRTLGIRTQLGRDFAETDGTSGRPVVIINEAFARRYFPDGDPVGRQIYQHAAGGGRATEVIGVVATTRSHRLNVDARPAMFFPVAQRPELALTLSVRTAASPSVTMGQVRDLVKAIDPQVPVFGQRTMAQQKDGSLALQRMAATLLTAFGALALLLASLGIHGVLAFSVQRRRREIGVRMAIGAGVGDVMRMILRQGAMMAGVGLILGMAGAWAAARGIRGFLYDVPPLDPATHAGVVLVLGTVMFAACWFPARRATRVDPVEALRGDG